MSTLCVCVFNEDCKWREEGLVLKESCSKCHHLCIHRLATQVSTKFQKAVPTSSFPSGPDPEIFPSFINTTHSHKYVHGSQLKSTGRTSNHYGRPRKQSTSGAVCPLDIPDFFTGSTHVTNYKSQDRNCYRRGTNLLLSCLLLPPSFSLAGSFICSGQES